ACVAHGTTLAQDVKTTFQQAVRLIRMNQEEAGLEKLREVLAAAPAHEDAFELWKAADVDVWQMLLNEGGEFEQIAKELMQRATLGRKELQRDDEAIQALVQKALSDEFSTRSRANAELAANYGEFAVPHLLRILGDTDAGRDQD